MVLPHLPMEGSISHISFDCRLARAPASGHILKAVSVLNAPVSPLVSQPLSTVLHVPHEPPRSPAISFPVSPPWPVCNHRSCCSLPHALNIIGSLGTVCHPLFTPAVVPRTRSQWAQRRYWKPMEICQCIQGESRVNSGNRALNLNLGRRALRVWAGLSPQAGGAMWLVCGGVGYFYSGTFSMTPYEPELWEVRTFPALPWVLPPRTKGASLTIREATLTLTRGFSVSSMEAEKG